MEDKDRVQWELIHYYVSVVLLGILGVILSPLIILCLGVLYIYKYVILVYSAKFFKPKLIQQLNFHESFYATDQFWGDSNGSFAFVVVVNGTVDIQGIRDEFSKKVIKARSSDNQDDIFGKMSRVPRSFGGYYFWQKANYFLIHEHIREIEAPTSEETLKKFLSTVLQLPFPNKRPLWEMLVFSHYEGEKSALVLRLHQVVADPTEAMNILCAFTNGKLTTEMEKNETVEKKDKLTLSERRDAILKIISNLVSQTKAFVRCIISSLKIHRHPQSIDKSCGVVSWTDAYEIPFRKITISQSVPFPALILSIIDGLLFAENYANYDRECWSMIKEQRAVMVSVPIKKATNELQSLNGFVVIKDLKEKEKTTETKCNFITRLQHISQELSNAKGQSNPEGSILMLKLLGLLPVPLQQLVVKCTFEGETFLYQECCAEITSANEIGLEQTKESSSPNSTDLISILEHEVLCIVPICGLTWPKTAVAVAVSKFQGKVTTSLTMNSGIQSEVDSLLKNIPQELDNIFEDAPDENGFISIPII